MVALVDSTPATSFTKGVSRATQLREALEILYHLQARVNTGIRKRIRKGRPSKLDCDGLEAEQIWSMMQLWDNALISWTEGMASTLLDARFPVKLLEASDSDGDVPLDEEDIDDSFEDEDDGFDEQDDHDEMYDDTHEDEFGENGRDKPDLNSKSSSTIKLDIDPDLDDEHFKVAEMESFAEKMESRMMKEWDEEDNLKKKLENGENIDEDDDDDERDSYDSEEGESETEYVKRALYGDGEHAYNDDDDEDDINVRFDEFFDSSVNQEKSSKRSSGATESEAVTKRAKAKAELAKRIAELENEALNEKPWELKGEIKATARPKDSLLQKEDLDVDFLKRATPALTPEVAAQIEDIILKRYLDARFDDVEVKADIDREAPPAAAYDLSREKSKEGLAETYAKDYAEKVLDQAPKEKIELDKEKAEIRGMFESLCQKLDALSNLVFTPKPPPSKDDANRPPDVAAVHMEDVMPTTETGTTSQAAPQEIEKIAKGVGKSRKEMEPEERRAARRKAKEGEKKRKAAAGIIKPVYNPNAKRTKVVEAKVAATNGDETSKVNWTSSAQVFKRLEESRAINPS